MLVYAKQASYLFGLIHECKLRRFSGASGLCGRGYDPAKTTFGAAGSENVSPISVSGQEGKKISGSQPFFS
jgi:hypothetical protein